MRRFFREYYLMQIDGEQVAVKRLFTPRASRWFAPDGSEYVSQSHISQIMSQFDDEHKLDISMLYEIVKDYEDGNKGGVTKEELQSESEARSKADIALQDDIAKEGQARIEAIQAEATAREEADIKLQENINSEKTERTKDVANINQNLALEAQARGEKDTALDEAIKAEAQARSAADTKLQEDLSKEGEARVAADEAINKELQNSVKYTDVATEQNLGRKAIVLENHDTILGKASDGQSYNLIMMSKWDKVDIGTGQKEINLNGSAERPTYNDSKNLALLEDIQAALGTITLEHSSDLQYTLKVGDAIIGTINIPQDNTLKSVEYNPDTKALDFVFLVDGEEQPVSVDIADLVDTYLAGDGLTLTGNVFSIKLDPASQKYIEVTTEGLKIVGIDEALLKKVDWVDVSTGENPGRRAILLNNHDVLLGKATNGEYYNLIMMSKWDKVDVGTAQKEINLNGSAERPTYNDDSSLALLKDVEEVDAKFGDYTKTEDLPTALPNPNKLTIKYNGLTALEYDGGSAGELDLVVNATTIPMAPEDNTPMSTYLSVLNAKFDNYALKTQIPTVPSSLPNPFGLTINYNGVPVVEYDGQNTVEGNFIINADTVPMGAEDNKSIATKITEVEDELPEESELGVVFNFPIRTLKDDVYSEETILGWFGATDIADLKGMISRGGQMYMKYGITLSYNPHYYRMPIQYIAFETNTQIKIVVLGLDTTNDNPCKYEIIMNLDGTIIEGNCNIKVTMTNFTMS